MPSQRELVLSVLENVASMTPEFRASNINNAIKEKYGKFISGATITRILMDLVGQKLIYRLTRGHGNVQSTYQLVIS